MMMRSIYLKIATAAVGLYAMVAFSPAPADAQPPLGAQTDVTVGTADEETHPRGALGDSTLLVIWRRSEVPDVANSRQDEVRGTLYQAGCEGNTALSPIASDILIMQQNAPVNSHDSNQFDRINIAYNSFSNEFIVIAGGRNDVDDNAPTAGTDDDDNTGEVWIQRVNADTGATVGSPVVLSNGIEPFVDGSGAQAGSFAVIQGSQANVACSSATGNILVNFGVYVDGTKDDNITTGAALFSSTLTRLDTTGARFFGNATRLGNSEPGEIETETSTNPSFNGSSSLGGGSILYDEETGKFVVSFRELFANTWPFSGLLNQISPPQVIVMTIDDGVQAGALVRSTPQIIVEGDFQADNCLTIDDLTPPEPGIASTVDDARLVKNPFRPDPNAQDDLYILLYRPARLWGIAQRTSGLRARAFGFAQNGDIAQGTETVLVNEPLSAAAEGSIPWDIEDACTIKPTTEFGERGFLVIIPNDGENGDPPGQTGRRNGVHYFLLNESLGFSTGFAVDDPEDLKLIGPANAGTDPDFFSELDTQDIISADGRGYALSTWDERTNTGETRHVVSRLIGTLPAVNSGPCIVKQPIPVSIEITENATFSVTAIGNGTLTYQWRFDGVDISGETNASLTVTAADLDDAGDYDVVVTDDDGNQTSLPALLTVNQELGARDSRFFE
jgi:hypothetical protein